MTRGEFDYCTSRFFLDFRSQALGAGLGMSRSGAVFFNGSAEDVLTISIPGGGFGTLVGSVRFDGTATIQVGTTPSMSDARFTANLAIASSSGGPLETNLSLFRDYLQLSGSPLTISGDAFGVYPVSIPFFSGFPVQVTMFSNGQAQSSSRAQGELASATGNFLNSSTWLGVTEVQDSTGAPVVNFTITTESGVDWVVPEPASGARALCALGALIMLRRYRAV